MRVESPTQPGVAVAPRSVAVMSEVVELDLTLLVANPDQPRKAFGEEGLEDLARSIRQNGVVEPVIVRPKSDGTYELVAGERRTRASRLAGCSTIPAIIRDDVDDVTLAILSLVENLCREDLTVVEEADHYIKLMAVGLTTTDIAERVGLPVMQVDWKVEFREKAIDKVIWLVTQGTMTGSMGWRVARLTANGQMRFLRELVKEPMTQQEQMGLIEAIFADENQQLLIEGFELSEEQVKAARTFRSVIDRAIDEAVRLEKMEDEMPGTLTAALETELDLSVQKIANLVARLQGISRKLQRRRGGKKASNG